MLCGPDGELPEKLRNLEPPLTEHVSDEIMDRDPNVCWVGIGNINSYCSFFFVHGIGNLHPCETKHTVPIV